MAAASAARRASATWRPRANRVSSARRCAWLLAAAAVLSALVPQIGEQTSFSAPRFSSPQRRGADRIARSSGSVLSAVENPVKTVSETIAEFYKDYPSPPVLPMYRSFLIDFMTSTHLAIVDSRFKYDAIFALGIYEYYNGLMGSYDKFSGGGEQTGKIWNAFIKALGMDPDKVKADAEAVMEFAKATAPAKMLSAMEGTEPASEPRVSEAFASISNSLYSMPFSVGLFKTMELSGVEASKANVEEWSKALKVASARPSGDLETYTLNKSKLQSAEEMIREIEIREKKKLADRLEAKAKALAEKAAKKAEEAREQAA